MAQHLDKTILLHTFGVQVARLGFARQAAFQTYTKNLLIAHPPWIASITQAHTVQPQMKGASGLDLKFSGYNKPTQPLTAAPVKTQYDVGSLLLASPYHYTELIATSAKLHFISTSKKPLEYPKDPQVEVSES